MIPVEESRLLYVESARDFVIHASAIRIRPQSVKRPQKHVSTPRSCEFRVC